MAKSLTSVIGLDIGRYSLKSVLMQKKGANRYVVTHFASHVLDESTENSPEELGKNIKALLKQMGGSAKACAVAVSHPDALLRIIDQPETPTDVLRDGLKLNGVALLNQDTKGYVLDCDLVPTAHPIESATGPQKRYLVAGLPREQVNEIGTAFHAGGAPPVAALQLAPVAVFNAFEFAQEDVFNNHAFFLLDIGHNSTTMLIGSKRELVLIRTVEFGGKSLIDTLRSLSGENRETVIQALAQEDEVMVENTRMALMALTREIGSSIGFFEGRREETIRQVWVSGGLSKSKTVLRVLSEELHMPCLAWNATERCEINIASARRGRFTEEMLDLSVACGAATEALKE
jgi:Tfp pilus assembly PilM family ATPase